MAELTEKQLDFLDKQNISLNDVCDISAMTTQQYKVFMKDNHYLIGYGGTPCKKAGHTLRLRHGHCAQCNTQGIAITQRKSMAGFVYVALSFSTGLVKIGVSSDYSKRELKLNSQKYGAINDWKIVVVCKGNNIGDIENTLHNEFMDYRVTKSFDKDGKSIVAQEIFKIQAVKVLSVIDKFDLECIKLDVTAIQRFDGLFADSHKKSGLNHRHLTELKQIEEHAIDNVADYAEEKQIRIHSARGTNSNQNNKVKIAMVTEPTHGQTVQVTDTTHVQHRKTGVSTQPTDKSVNFANLDSCINSQNTNNSNFLGNSDNSNYLGNSDNSNNSHNSDSFDNASYADSYADGKSLEEREAELRMFLPSNTTQIIDDFNQQKRKVNSNKNNKSQITFLQEVYIVAINLIVILSFLGLLYLFIA